MAFILLSVCWTRGGLLRARELQALQGASPAVHCSLLPVIIVPVCTYFPPSFTRFMIFRRRLRVYRTVFVRNSHLQVTGTINIRLHVQQQSDLQLVVPLRYLIGPVSIPIPELRTALRFTFALTPRRLRRGRNLPPATRAALGPLLIRRF